MMSKKLLIVATAFGLSSIGLASYIKNDKKEFVSYVDAHPEEINGIIDYAISSADSFTESNLESMANAIKLDVIRNNNSTYILDITKFSIESKFKKDIVENFSDKEKLEMLEEAVRYKASRSINGTQDVLTEIVEKLRETKLYDDFFKEKEERTIDAADKMRETEAYSRLNGFFENLKGNIRKRVLNE